MVGDFDYEENRAAGPTDRGRVLIVRGDARQGVMGSVTRYLSANDNGLRWGCSFSTGHIPSYRERWCWQAST